MFAAVIWRAQVILLLPWTEWLLLAAWTWSRSIRVKWSLVKNAEFEALPSPTWEPAWEQDPRSVLCILQSEKPWSGDNIPSHLPYRHSCPIVAWIEFQLSVNREWTSYLLGPVPTIIIMSDSGTVIWHCWEMVHRQTICQPSQGQHPAESNLRGHHRLLFQNQREKAEGNIFLGT